VGSRGLKLSGNDSKSEGRIAKGRDEGTECGNID